MPEAPFRPYLQQQRKGRGEEGDRCLGEIGKMKTMCMIDIREQVGQACHMMVSSALRTMYLTPEARYFRQSSNVFVAIATPAICKFLPMMEAGLAAAAQIWKNK
jgi:hypothetical protein